VITRKVGKESRMRSEKGGVSASDEMKKFGHSSMHALVSRFQRQRNDSEAECPREDREFLKSCRNVFDSVGIGE